MYPSKWQDPVNLVGLCKLSRDSKTANTVCHDSYFAYAHLFMWKFIAACKIGGGFKTDLSLTSFMLRKAESIITPSVLSLQLTNRTMQKKPVPAPSYWKLVFFNKKKSKQKTLPQEINYSTKKGNKRN